MAGCHPKSTAVPISLARFGGTLKLKLNVNRNDKFVYEETTESKMHSSSFDLDCTETVVTDYEVIDRTPDGTRMTMTERNAKVESEIEERAQQLRRLHKKFKDLAIEGIYDETGAQRSLNAVSTDPNLQSLATDRFGKNPGLHGVVFSREALTIGKQWTVATRIGCSTSLLDMLLQMLSGEEDQTPQTPLTFTLTGAEEDQGKTLAVIEYSAQHVAEPESTKIGDGKATISFGFDTASSFTLKGTARIDVDTGMVVSDESETKEEMSVGEFKQTETVKRTTHLKPSGA